MSAPQRPASQWSLPASMLALGVGIPALFWLQFGHVDGFALGFTGFLLLLALALHVLPGKVAALAPFARAHEVAPGRLDWLGAVWLFAIPTAPLLGWLLTSVPDLDADSWRVPVTLRAGLCVVLPVVSVLPLLRYVRGRPAPFLLAILGIGTLFPVLTGWGAALDAVRGPRWEDVTVDALEDLGFRTAAGIRVRRAGAFVLLRDGRRLTHAEGLRLAPGPHRVLVLGGLGRILAAQ